MVGGTGVYNVGNTNFSRRRSFIIHSQSGLSTTFVILRGTATQYPHVGEITAPTANQRIAQERLDAVVRSLSRYAPPIRVKVIDYTVGGGETSNAVQMDFETEQSGVFADSSGGANITDTLGLGGEAAKTKLGLQALATALITTVTLDGGSTLLFSASPTLQDGTASTASAVTTLTVVDNTW